MNGGFPVASVEKEIERNTSYAVFLSVFVRRNLDAMNNSIALTKRSIYLIPVAETLMVVRCSLDSQNRNAR